MLRAIVCLLVLLTASSALAREPRRIALHYTRSDAAMTCADPTDIARRVESYTGPVLVMPAAAEAALEAHVDASKDGYRAHVRLVVRGQEPHERVLEHPTRDCESFSATLAFVIATTIDADVLHAQVNGLFEDGEPEAELLAELERDPPRPVVLPPRVLPKPPAPPPAPLPKLRTLAFGPAVSDEPIAWGLGASATGRYLWRERFGIALSGRGVFALDRIADLAQTAALALDALGCIRRALPRKLGATLCVGPELSGLHALGIGLRPVRRGWLWAGGVHARGELAYRVSSHFALALVPYASLSAPSRRLTFGQNEVATTIGETRPFSFGVAIELQRIF